MLSEVGAATPSRDFFRRLDSCANTAQQSLREVRIAVFIPVVYRLYTCAAHSKRLCRPVCQLSTTALVFIGAGLGLTGAACVIVSSCVALNLQQQCKDDLLGPGCGVRLCISRTTTLCPKMARQQQQRKISKGAFGCAPSATQAGNSSVQDNQASLHGVGACSSL